MGGMANGFSSGCVEVLSATFRIGAEGGFVERFNIGFVEIALAKFDFGVVCPMAQYWLRRGSFGPHRHGKGGPWPNGAVVVVSRSVWPNFNLGD